MALTSFLFTCSHEQRCRKNVVKSNQKNVFLRMWGHDVCVTEFRGHLRVQGLGMGDKYPAYASMEYGKL